jgi:hypothetical protein
MRLERLARRVCDATTIVLVCLGFLLTASTSHAHIAPDALNCTSCPGAGPQCLGTVLSCPHDGVEIPCGCCGCQPSPDGDGFSCQWGGEYSLSPSCVNWVDC